MFGRHGIVIAKTTDRGTGRGGGKRFVGGGIVGRSLGQDEIFPEKRSGSMGRGEVVMQGMEVEARVPPLSHGEDQRTGSEQVRWWEEEESKAIRHRFMLQSASSFLRKHTETDNRQEEEKQLQQIAR